MSGVSRIILLLASLSSVEASKKATLAKQRNKQKILEQIKGRAVTKQDWEDRKIPTWHQEERTINLGRFRDRAHARGDLALWSYANVHEAMYRAKAWAKRMAAKAEEEAKALEKEDEEVDPVKYALGFRTKKQLQEIVDSMTMDQIMDINGVPVDDPIRTQMAKLDAIKIALKEADVAGFPEAERMARARGQIPPKGIVPGTEEWQKWNDERKAAEKAKEEMWKKEREEQITQLAQTSSATPEIISVFPVAFIGLFLCSGVSFTVFRFGSFSTLAKSPLLG